MEIYDFGLRLKELRKQKRLSQKEAGSRIGVSRSAINGYEANTQMPAIMNLRKLALLYDSTTDYILGITDQSHYVKEGLTPQEQQTIFKVVDLLAESYLTKNR